MNVINKTIDILFEEEIKCITQKPRFRLRLRLRIFLLVYLPFYADDIWKIEQYLTLSGVDLYELFGEIE